MILKLKITLIVTNILQKYELWIPFLRKHIIEHLDTVQLGTAISVVGFLNIGTRLTGYCELHCQITPTDRKTRFLCTALKNISKENYTDLLFRISENFLISYFFKYVWKYIFYIKQFFCWASNFMRVNSKNICNYL